MITLHLLLAVLVVFSLLFVFARLSPKSTQTFPQQAKDRAKALSQLLFVTMLLTLGQILLGTFVRESLDEVVKRLGYDQRGNWIANLDWQFYVHRSFSLVVLALQLVTIYRLRRFDKNKWLSAVSFWLIVLVVVEIATGVIMAYLEVPALAQPIHLLLATVIVGLQFVAWLVLTPGLIQIKRISQPAQVLNI